MMVDFLKILWKFFENLLKTYWHTFEEVWEYSQGDEEKSTLKGKRRESWVGETRHRSLREHGLRSCYYDE